jgi:hypothetical protein
VIEVGLDFFYLGARPAHLTARSAADPSAHGRNFASTFVHFSEDCLEFASGKTATMTGVSMSKFLLLLGLLAFASLSLNSIGRAAQIMSTSGECIDLPHGNTADGTPLTLFHCHGSPNQQWTFSAGQITGMGGSCIDVQGSAAADGAPVILVACNGKPSQHWGVSNGQIVGIGGKCLDSVRGGTTDGTPLIIVTCSTSPTQQWSLQ